MLSGDGWAHLLEEVTVNGEERERERETRERERETRETREKATTVEVLFAMLREKREVYLNNVRLFTNLIYYCAFSSQNAT